MSTTQQIPVGRRGHHTLVDEADALVLRTHWWSLHGRGYAHRPVGPRGLRRSLLMHRFLMGLDFGDRREVDHINGDKLDNRRANLRVVTHAQNGQNVRISIPRTSSYRGVYRITARGRWAAKAKLNGQDVWIGLFDDEREAALAAEAYRRSHMPFAEPDPLLEALERSPEAAA